MFIYLFSGAKVQLFFEIKHFPMGKLSLFLRNELVSDELKDVLGCFCQHCGSMCYEEVATAEAPQD